MKKVIGLTLTLLMLAVAFSALGDSLVSAVPSAVAIKDKGNTNTLTITVVETYESGATKEITATFKINNNAADTYQVDGYKVFVNTKGNIQIRECYIVEAPVQEVTPPPMAC